MAKTSNKFNLYLSIALILVSCVLACGTFIPNDYVKLVLVLIALGYGIYGVMKALSSSPEEKTETKEK